MGRIFISYRREGAAGFAGRLAEDLERRFGASEIFRDVEDIASGEDFVERLDRALGDCRVMIAVVDKTWLAADRDGRRRLHDPNDFVRMEIARALKSGVRVIPALVDGAAMPAERDLPAELKPFARRQGQELSDSRWDYDVERLARAISDTLADTPASSGQGESTARRRRMVALAVLASLVAVGAAAWQALSRVPDLDGTWDLPDGSYWIVRQSGRGLEIDVVHYESKQVWQRGHGSVAGDKITFKLDLVYQPGYSIGGELRISGDAKRIGGIAVSSPTGNRTEILLQRR